MASPCFIPIVALTNLRRSAFLKSNLGKKLKPFDQPDPPSRPPSPSSSPAPPLVAHNTSLPGHRLCPHPPSVLPLMPHRRHRRLHLGNSAAVFQDCDIHTRCPDSGQRNMLTTQGRDDPNQNTDIVIQKCYISATSELLPVISSFPTYLGRPWKEYSHTVVIQSQISNIINPAGWYPWNGNFALDTLYYAEYQNTGAGTNTANRVTWKGYKVITSTSEAQQFTAANFISGGSWLSSTGFPFSLGL